uniref:Sushi domain-containing protein n=1 Tax=Scleropages formosus TaxID=113540 RepID=A0A8C9VSQ7_SCLFO
TREACFSLAVYKFESSLMMIFCFTGQCSKPQFEGNVVLSSDLQKKEFPEGSIASFQCAMGYTREQGSTKVTCSNGTWSALQLKCQKKSCGSPGEVLHVLWSFSRYYGDPGMYFCRSHEYKTVHWMKNPTDFFPCVHVAQKCKDPPTIKNGRIISIPETEFPQYGDVIEYTCNKGYHLSGNSLIACGINGEYDSQFPQCEGHIIVYGFEMYTAFLLCVSGQPCSKPFFRSNVVLTKADWGKNSFPHGSVTTFECAPGFERKSGSGNINCTAQHWSDLTLECQSNLLFRTGGLICLKETNLVPPLK